MSYIAYPKAATTPNRKVRKAERSRIFVENKTHKKRERSKIRRARKLENS